MQETHDNFFDFMKPLIITFVSITISLLPYLEEGLRIGTLTIGLSYTCFKFYKEYKIFKNKK